MQCYTNDKRAWIDFANIPVSGHGRCCWPRYIDSGCCVALPVSYDVYLSVCGSGDVGGQNSKIHRIHMDSFYLSDHELFRLYYTE